MKECILCGENRQSYLEEHPTIPKTVNSEWEQKVDLCIECRRKINRYIIKDLVEMVLEIRDGFLELNKIFCDTGIVDNDVPVTTFHYKVLNVLFKNIPKADSRKETISFKDIINECGLEYNKKNGQKLGYAIRKFRLKDTKRTSKGKVFIYTPNNVTKLKHMYENRYKYMVLKST